MNPLQEQRRIVDPAHIVVITSMEGESQITYKWESYCEYPRFAVDEPHNSMGIKGGGEGLSLPSHNRHREESTSENPDGSPLEVEEEDPELARKRKELQAIEEKIMLKKASIALKTVKPFGDDMSPGLPCDVEGGGVTLRDKVNVILQEKHPFRRPSKVQLHKDRVSSSSLRPADHPLKVRVNALISQKCTHPSVLLLNTEMKAGNVMDDTELKCDRISENKPKVPDVVPLLPPSQDITSPPEEENHVNKGFLRFLDVLNKGVDMNLLSRIVNDDSEDLPLSEEALNIKPPAVEGNSDEAFHIGSQTPSNIATPPRRSQPSSEERKMVPPEPFHSDRCSLPDDEEHTNERDRYSLACRSPPKSPPAKKKKTEKEEKTKVDEQQEQLQKILKTLGLSLEPDELSRLADRTQERLYGKKPHGNQKPDSRQERDSQGRDSFRHERHSSASPDSRQDSDSQKRGPHNNQRHSSSSSSSHSSKCASSSPVLHRCHSRSTCSPEHHKQERILDKSRDVHDVEQNTRQMYINQVYLSPFSQDYSLTECSEYVSYHNSIYSNPESSHYIYAQDAIPSVPLLPPHNGFTYPQTLQNFPGSAAGPSSPTEKSHLCSDLSASEGQSGLTTRPRYLTSVSSSETIPTVMSSHRQKRFQRMKRLNLEKYKGKQNEQITKSEKLNSEREKGKQIEQRMERERLNSERNKAKQKEQIMERERINLEINEGTQIGQRMEREQADKYMRVSTEEDIGVYLRKQLEAVTQKMRQNITKPADSLT